MFQGWARADIISAIALIVSCAAAAFTWQQMRIARRKELADAAASDPVVEVDMKASDWPGWYEIHLVIRNRSDMALVCSRLSITQPKGALLATDDDAIAEAGGGVDGYIRAERKPPVTRLRRDIDLGLRISRTGSEREAGGFFTRAGVTVVRSLDVRHLDILAFSASRVSSRKRVVFRMSLRTERTNASAPYREIKVVASATPVATSMTI